MRMLKDGFTDSKIKKRSGHSIMNNELKLQEVELS